MKVGNNNWNIRHVEQTYQQTRPTLKPTRENTSAAKTNQSLKIRTTAKTPIQPADILSPKEMATLRALFEDQFSPSVFYGRNQVKNIHSGFLLDVRG